MHATPTTYGPLKTDITKACPADMPKSERDEKCKLSLIFDFDVYSHIKQYYNSAILDAQ